MLLLLLLLFLYYATKQPTTLLLAPPILALKLASFLKANYYIALWQKPKETRIAWNYPLVQRG